MSDEKPNGGRRPRVITMPIGTADVEEVSPITTKPLASPDLANPESPAASPRGATEAKEPMVRDAAPVRAQPAPASRPPGKKKDRVSILLAALGAPPTRPAAIAAMRSNPQPMPAPPPVPISSAIRKADTLVDESEDPQREAALNREFNAWLDDGAPQTAKPPPRPQRQNETLPLMQISPDLVEPDAELPPPVPSIPPPAPPPKASRKHQWFDVVFDRDFLALVPDVTPAETLRDVAMIEEWMNLAANSDLLDLACGVGRHAIELASNGHRVTGYDASDVMLDDARRAAQERNADVRFVRGDLRDISWDNKFDAVFCLDTSFGYFADEENAKMIRSMHRALRSGGKLLLDAVNRDYVVRDVPARIWWEGKECVVLEEVDFDFTGSRIRNKRAVVFENGRHLEHEISIRAYSRHELVNLLQESGFKVLEVSGNQAHRGRFFGRYSRQQIIVAEKV